MLKIICSLQKYSASRLTAVTVIFVLGMLFRKTLARMMGIEVKFIDKYAFLKLSFRICLDKGELFKSAVFAYRYRQFCIIIAM